MSNVDLESLPIIEVIGRDFFAVANDVLDRLLLQGFICSDVRGCVYNGDAGSRCAVGWILPGSTDFDGNILDMISNDYVRDTYTPGLNHWITSHASELRALQLVHDMAACNVHIAIAETAHWPVQLRDKRNKWFSLFKDELYQADNLKLGFVIEADILEGMEAAVAMWKRLVSVDKEYVFRSKLHRAQTYLRSETFAVLAGKITSFEGN